MASLLNIPLQNHIQRQFEIENRKVKQKTDRCLHTVCFLKIYTFFFLPKHIIFIKFNHLLIRFNIKLLLIFLTINEA